MILVTGGTGLLGSHLLHLLTRYTEPVRALKRPDSSLQYVRLLFNDDDEQWKRIQWMDGDITDVISLQDAMQDVRKIYHCAALISYHARDRDELIEINRNGTANVVNLCLELGIEKLCYASSVAVLDGSSYDEPITEDAGWVTGSRASVYALSKQAAEREVWRGMAEGLNAVIVNPGIILGAGNWYRGSGQLFNWVWKGLPFYTAGGAGFVSAADAALCMYRLMESHHAHERFIVVSENLSYREVLFHIADSLGKKRPSLQAGKTLSQVYWLTTCLLAWLGGKRPAITREMAEASQRILQYSNKKIREATGIEFEKIKAVIEQTAAIFLQQFYPVRR
jgi:nucleoside-diphosphate-sugar epimerase